MLGDELVMELTLEQGEDRVTQVQPPLDVWIRYFNTDLDDPLPVYLHNLNDPGGGFVEHSVVEHDHNWTVELPGAELPRPAIVHFQRQSEADRYSYAVYRPGDAEFDHYIWMLDTFANPYRKRGRRWLII